MDSSMKMLLNNTVYGKFEPDTLGHGLFIDSEISNKRIEEYNKEISELKDREQVDVSDAFPENPFKHKTIVLDSLGSLYGKEYSAEDVFLTRELSNHLDKTESDKERPFLTQQEKCLNLLAKQGKLRKKTKDHLDF